eukprot:scaffold51_cov401-Prasinococcus_capsulatus_cf.AAC.38
MSYDGRLRRRGRLPRASRSLSHAPTSHGQDGTMSPTRKYGINRTIHKDAVTQVEYNYPSWMPFTVKFLPNQRQDAGPAGQSDGHDTSRRR